MVLQYRALEPGLLQNRFNCTGVKVSGMIWNGNLAGFRWMDVRVMRTLCFLELPSIRQYYFFYFPESHDITSLQLYYTHNAHKSQGEFVIKKNTGTVMYLHHFSELCGSDSSCLTSNCSINSNIAC